MGTPVKLRKKEEALRDDIKKVVEKVRKAASDIRLQDDLSQDILEAGKKAHKLHMELKDRDPDLEPRHHGYMIENRGCQPDQENFYMHFHPLEDLLAFLEDSEANDDPKDQTLGEEFTFSVNSPRWPEAPDRYLLKRTQDGWDFRHMSIFGPCDKRGRPFLFRSFRQDSIPFPGGLEDELESLWENAASQDLTKDKVQSQLQKLADWVTLTGQSVPSLDDVK